ncbi:MobF family relaxase [Mycolicibacterium obuense]|uniref:Multifunctional conjugation protein TraI n=1 Tax=Mycolicibacterium obuense TaxID=1807 RepID=A0A0J6YGA5_9MYCO|nr:MobF family relaxase [Mycolicibacterium obuense]KMO71916.1 Multifunctional conjugation protein TraI [Mycolicibacterium obuense]
MLTISRLSRWSIGYYNDTANQARQASMDRQAAGGGLGEYYSEGDTRVPTWVVVGDKATVGEATGLDGAALDGGFADTETAARWLDDGVTPNGEAGRAFGTNGVHGFDLMFAAPKSVSLLRSLTDDVAEKVMQNAHVKAVEAAMTYLHEHAGYTRVHNPLTSKKDLQRLPGLVAIAYQHETSRCGDPHLHTHVIVPNRQVRADGRLVSIDSKSLYHEAKAAGIIYQATLRHELHAERGFEWQPVDEHSGMAEIAGVTAASIKAWSQRSTRLREWAKDNLVVVDGEPTAAQLATAQKATRPTKPEQLAWDELKAMWRADARGLDLDRDAHFAAREARRAQARTPLDRARIAHMAARIDKAAFTRADMVEIVGAQLPVGAVGEPRALIEAFVDDIGVRISAPREAHHREGHQKYTVDAIMLEESRILDMVDTSDNRSRLDVRATDLGDLSADQERAIRNIAVSPFLVQPLQAPAGAGKTHSLKALRAAAHRANKDVLVLAPTGKAVDEAMQEEAGDRGLTVAKALKLIEDNNLAIDRRTVVIVDEASMVGTPELKKLLSAAVAGRAKMVLVGDPYQLAPVKARGGMFEHLCGDLPWSQRLGEVWRMRSTEERDASLALRSGHGNRLRKAVGWYRSHGRLHTGDPIAMAKDAGDAYLADRAAGKDSLMVCDSWEMADALNQRVHNALVGDGPSVRAARDQRIAVGDIIISRENDISIPVHPGAEHPVDQAVDQVRNGNRWRVAGIDEKTNRVAAERLTDKARVVFDGDYLRQNVTLGYAVTVHSAQGVTVGNKTTPGVCHSILADTSSRAMAYVGMTRAKDENHAYIYQRISGEADHEHSRLVAGADIHVLRRGNKWAAAHHFRTILANDDRPRTMHAEAERTERDLLPQPVSDLLVAQEQRRNARSAVWREHSAAGRAAAAAYQRMATVAETVAERERERDRDRGRDIDGLEL